MLRLNYKKGNTIETKFFDTVTEGYKWALENVVTQGDREYYYECCGKTFEQIGQELESKNPSLLTIVMKNAMENVRYVDIE